MKVGLEKMDAQAWAEAVTQFDQVLEKNPNQATALNAKGVALFQQGKIKEAIPFFDQAIQVESGTRAGTGSGTIYIKSFS